MFAASGLMLLNKTDLLPHLDFDVARCLDYARRVNPDIRILQLSARTGEGMDAWLTGCGKANRQHWRGKLAARKRILPPRGRA
ncbi:MAG: GTP-binding protein [Candidatus Competibacteraceae bacterium]